MRYCPFHIFAILVTADAAISDGQFVKKNIKASNDDICDTIFV